MAVIINEPSVEGIQFTAREESPGGRAVTQAYYCPAGALTIGHGFTMSSGVFAAYWREKHGRGLQIGDTIDPDEADYVLGQLIKHEYGAAVAKNIRPTRQHHYDSASCMALNCGTGSTHWRWAVALRDGDIEGAARLLETTAVTANGRKLQGLKNRRKRQARLLRTGQYTSGPTQGSDRAEIREYQQQLKDLGFKVGPIDGIHGRMTDAAVREFQNKRGLKIDGIVGPATRSALIRALDEKSSETATGTGTLAGGAGGGGTEALYGDLSKLDALITIGVGALVVAGVVYGAYWLYRNRGRFTGVRVPV